MTEKKTGSEERPVIETKAEQEEKKPKAPRQPQRRKRAVSNGVAENQGEQIGPEGATGPEAPALPAKPPRRMGRPRKKIEVLPAAEAEGAEISSVSAADAGTDPVASVPKKRPGRPPRKKLPAVASSDNQGELSSESSVPGAGGEGSNASERIAHGVMVAPEAGAEPVGQEKPAPVREEGAETMEPQPLPRKRPARPRRKKKPVGEAVTMEQGQAQPEALVMQSDDPVGSTHFSNDDENDEVPDIEEEKIVSPTDRRLLINAEEPEECRIAILEDGRLESLHVSTVAREHTKSNIYKARIVAIESNLQAAFIDYGPDKNGFLPFSEIHPEYYRADVSDKTLKLIEQHQWKKLNINEVLERGQEMLVQVVKEEVGNKGANMTTYLSLPGRCVVLMPGSDSAGISRKISGEERRSSLRAIMDGLEIPEGIGWIVRTASVDLNEHSLSKDVASLLKLWGEIKAKGQAMGGVGLIYQDHDCVLRFLREHFDPEIKEILVDDLAAMEKVQDFIDMLPDIHRKTKVRLHKGARPIFNQYNVEDQIESIYQPRVTLPSGGSIVIDPTEALVAIDVNSGSTGKGQNFEEAIFKANMEAATELTRQLRLRDLGGLIVVDFIDMRSQKNIRAVEQQVKMAMKRDKAKADISRISKFGLMQISRQKLGAPVEALNYQVCSHCLGRGVVRSVETLALFYLRRIQTGASRKGVAWVECRFPSAVAHYLLNNKRQELVEMERKHRLVVEINADPSLKPADNEIHFHKVMRERARRGGSGRAEAENETTEMVVAGD